MKTRIMLAFALFPLALTAQETDMSLLSGDKVWTVEVKGTVSPEYGDVFWHEETRLDGDTIIEGIRFKRKYRRIWRLGEEKPDVWTSLDEYLGQDGGKVYLFSRRYSSSSLGTLHLIMDFSAQEGEVVHVGSMMNESYTVTDVSDVAIANSDDKCTLHCLQVRLGQTCMTDTWIEGIGSLLFGVSYTLPEVGGLTHLYRCIDGEKILYQWDTIDAISDSPRLMNSEGMNNGAGTVVFDLHGRRLTSKPEKGVYIEGGRKRVAGK